MRDDNALRHELDVACRLARQAGKRILLHRGGAIDVQRKENDEVVTAADREANDVISSGLGEAFPQDAIYSEEAPDSWRRLAQWRVWIVDPLDGTSDFIAGGDEFSVSIGLAIGGEAVVGAVYNPVRDELFAGAAGLGVERNGVPACPSDVAQLHDARITVSRKERSQLALLAPDLALTGITSMSYKLARVAAGIDDAALSRKRRKEWGSCAGVALVLAGGGRATLLDGRAIRFNRAERKQPLGMVAAGARLHAPLVHSIQHLVDPNQGGLS
jgi:myo-inositol-1(or 4)-monophosphatase